MTNTYKTPKKDTELNERIAREVMGWRQHDEYKHLWYTQDTMAPGLTLPNFSGDIGDAWMVVEKIEQGFLLECDHGKPIEWKCQWATHEKVVSAKAETAPLAICLAAIKTVSK